MALRVRQPHPRLAPFVEFLWLVDRHTPAGERERVLPTGACDLVINLKDDVTRVYDAGNVAAPQIFSGGVVSGARSQCFVIDADEQEQTSAIGVHFRPGGAFQFFNVRPGDLRNRHVSLDVLWGRGASDLRNELLEASSPQAMFDVLERALAHRATKSPHRAVQFALGEFCRSPRPSAIADVARRVGLSSRRFIEVFEAEVGLTPKRFCRVRRFQKALRHVRDGRAFDWADVAVACGYYDQAHFIHDVRAFSGLSPSAYEAAADRRSNHVPIRD